MKGSDVQISNIIYISITGQNEEITRQATGTAITVAD
jgi:hypothetical protein